MPHLDKACANALLKLDEELSQFERTTGRKYTLILIPQTLDEKIHMSQNGRPLPDNIGISPQEVLAQAMKRRS